MVIRESVEESFQQGSEGLGLKLQIARKLGYWHKVAPKLSLDLSLLGGGAIISPEQIEKLSHKDEFKEGEFYLVKEPTRGLSFVLVRCEQIVGNCGVFYAGGRVGYFGRLQQSLTSLDITKVEPRVKPHFIPKPLLVYQPSPEPDQSLIVNTGILPARQIVDGKVDLGS